MESLSGLLRIGLTGGIGSGKSTAAATFVALGATLIDTDAIARSLTAAGGAALPALRKVFGERLFDAAGALDRAAMRELVFGSPEARRELEAVLHPMIGAQVAQQAATAPADTLVFDVPLLAESAHWRARVQRVLVIDCGTATQVARVAQRPGWTREAAERVVAAQATRATRRGVADAVIHNDDGMTLPGLAAAVASVREHWLRACREPVEQ